MPSHTLLPAKADLVEEYKDRPKADAFCPMALRLPFSCSRLSASRFLKRRMPGVSPASGAPRFHADQPINESANQTRTNSQQHERHLCIIPYGRKPESGIRPRKSRRRRSFLLFASLIFLLTRCLNSPISSSASSYKKRQCQGNAIFPRNSPASANLDLPFS